MKVLITTALLSLMAATANADGPTPITSASDLGLDSSVEVLGTYRISGISTLDRGKRFDACVASTDAHGISRDPDSRCGKQLWVVRTEKQLALLDSSVSGSPSTDPDTADSQRVYSSLFYGKYCDDEIPLSEAKTSLFADASKFCRAFAVSGPAGGQSFSFKENAKPVGPGAEHRAATGAYNAVGLAVGLGIGVASDFIVRLPNGERSPQSFKITETVDGMMQVVFIPLSTHWVNTITLTYVGP